MLAQLFSSSARVKVLGLLILNPIKSYYQREIANLLELPVRAVQRETARMVNFGLLQRLGDGNRVYFQTNTKHFLFPELKRIFLKTLGVNLLLGQNLRPSPDVELAFIYGPCAADVEEAENDINLFVIGSITMHQLSTTLAEFYKRTQRKINPYLMTADELHVALVQGNSFLKHVLAAPKLFILGDKQSLQSIAA